MCNRKFCRNYIRKIKLDLLNWVGKVCELIIYMGQHNKIKGKVVFYISEKGRAIERRKIFEKKEYIFLPRAEKKQPRREHHEVDLVWRFCLGTKASLGMISHFVRFCRAGGASTISSKDLDSQAVLEAGHKFRGTKVQELFFLSVTYQMTPKEFGRS